MRRLLVGLLAACALLAGVAPAKASTYSDAHYTAAMFAALHCSNFARCNYSNAYDSQSVALGTWRFSVTWQGLWTVPGRTYQCWSKITVYPSGGWVENGWSGGARVCGYL
jgi:hypothetical protein